MQIARISVPLHEDAYRALEKDAMSNYRDIRRHAGYLIVEALRHAQLLDSEKQSGQPGGKEGERELRPTD